MEEDYKKNSVLKQDQVLMSFKLFKFLTITIIFSYISGCLIYLLNLTSVLCSLQASVKFQLKLFIKVVFAALS